MPRYSYSLYTESFTVGMASSAWATGAARAAEVNPAMTKALGRYRMLVSFVDVKRKCTSHRLAGSVPPKAPR